MSKSTKVFLIILSVLVFIGFGVFLFFSLLIVNLTGSVADDGDDFTTIGSGSKIGVVELEGEILASADIVRQIKRFRENRAVRGILLRVDSPGGGVVASQEIYEEVRKTRESGKSIVVSMGALAASGGYYVACGASEIVANPGTLTGSIGVISQFMNLDTLMHKLGIDMNTIKSGKFKDAGNPFREMTSDDRAYFQKLMDDVHQQFIDVVSRERNFEKDSVVLFADGRVFTGEQAYEMGLVDTLGTYEDAINITAALCGIEGEPSLLKKTRRGPSLFERLFGEVKIPDMESLKEEFLNKPILQYRMVQSF